MAQVRYTICLNWPLSYLHQLYATDAAIVTYLGRYVYYVLTPKNVRASSVLAMYAPRCTASLHQLDASPKNDADFCVRGTHLRVNTYKCSNHSVFDFTKVKT